MPGITASPTAAEAVAFWLNAGQKAWFARDDAFDADLRWRFLDLHMAASRGELEDWAATAVGALALLLALDQFPRNLFRGSAHAFATDPLARAVARDAYARRLYEEVDLPLRQFFCLPFEHSEDRDDQELSMEMAQALAEMGDENSLKWSRIHKDIVDRFGRFPHRNKVLGRDTTPAEQDFLDGGGFSG
jgi:uncharacterized protein (DUF924 family)